MIPDSLRPSSEVDDELFEPDDLNPELIQETCREAVELWPILAIGERPKDWFTYDLLLHRLRRDRRLWMQRVMMRKPDDWIRARVKHLPGARAGKASLHERGIHLTVLHYLHYVQLYRVRNWILEDQRNCDPPYLLKRWQRLMNCPPSGALYANRDKARPCNLLHLCPWCRARFGVYLWQRLQAAGHGAELVLLRYQVSSDTIALPRVRPGQCSSSGDRYQVNRRYTEPDEDAPGDWLILTPPPEEDWPLHPDDVYACLMSRQMTAARSVLKEQLEIWSSFLGFEAGYKFYTVEPTVEVADSGKKFRQHMWWGYVLAPIPKDCSDPELWDELARTTLYPTDYPQDERKILEVGSARRLLTEILGWPPLCLYDGRQYWHYHAQNWRQSLYVPFGHWRKLLTRVPKPDPFASPPAREFALRLGNHRRQKAAAARTDRLLEIAKPLWQQIQANTQRAGRGRPPYRQRLRELFEQRNIDLTEWQLRRVLAALRKSDKESRQS